MDAFEDGNFPPGTSCSGDNEHDNPSRYCVNGRCISFNEHDFAVDEHPEDIVAFKHLFKKETPANGNNFIRRRKKRSLAFNYDHIDNKRSIVNGNNKTTIEYPHLDAPQRPTDKWIGWYTHYYHPLLRPVRFESSKNDTMRLQPYVWTMFLSDCSVPCGQGVQTIHVTCRVGRITVDENLCDHKTRPGDTAIRVCHGHHCPSSNSSVSSN